MRAGPRGELPACGRVALDRRGHFVELDAEHVVQQERRAFERREPFEREQQRQRDVFLFIFLDDRLGQPRADIGLALVPRGLQLVEAHPHHHPAQERFRYAHLGAVDVHPADERLLHHVLGIRDGTEHPVRDADQRAAQRVEARGRIGPFFGAAPGRVEVRHQATIFAAAAFASAGSIHNPKPTARRFQPLITLIISVSFTCSSWLKWSFNAA